VEQSEPIDEVLFSYYAEQCRHTEHLRLELTKFFSGLVSGIAVAGGFFLQDPGAEASVVRLLASAGLAVSLVAVGTLWLYQHLIEQWVAAKDALESQLLRCETRIDLSPLRDVRPLSHGRSVAPRLVAILPFSAMALAFAGLLLFPGLLARSA
jgi:hypothetical protein